MTSKHTHTHTRVCGGGGREKGRRDREREVGVVRRRSFCLPGGTRFPRGVVCLYIVGLFCLNGRSLFAFQEQHAILGAGGSLPAENFMAKFLWYLKMSLCYVECVQR